jgi:hypothetical protein
MSSVFHNSHLGTVLTVFEFTILNGYHHGTPYTTFLFALNRILHKLSLPSVGNMLNSLHYLMTCVGINAYSKESCYQTSEMTILKREKLFRRKM